MVPSTMGAEDGAEAEDSLLGFALAIVVLAIVFALPTLSYPYGRDQGLFHYVGSEWLHNGLIPYRDLIEHRPPGLHVVYGVLSLAFGDSQWPIRVFDIGLVLVLGVCSASIVAERDRRVPREYCVLGSLFATIAYFGFFDFWHTAQVDFTYMVLCFVGLAAVRRLRRVWPAVAVAGLSVGVALIVKPPALFMAICVAVVLSIQASKDGASRKSVSARLAVFATLASLPWLSTLAYFQRKGALGEFWTWNFSVNAYYAVHERSASSLLDVLFHGTQAFARLSPFSTVLLVLLGVALVAAHSRKDKVSLRRHGTLAGFCVITWVGVAAQFKFYWYHHAVLVGPLTLLALSLFIDFERWAIAAHWKKINRYALAAGAVVFAFPLSASFPAWFYLYRDSIRHAVGEISSSEYYAHFRPAGQHFDARENWAVAQWLARNSEPTDSVAVRGFEPQIYLMAGRRYRGSRFFWTNFITDRRRSMLHDQWLAEEDAAVRAHPPRFVVALCERGPVVCADWHQARASYVQRVQYGPFRILERVP